MVLGPQEIKLSQSYVFTSVSNELDRLLRSYGSGFARAYWDGNLALGRAIEENAIELSEMLESAYRTAGWAFVVATITSDTSEFGSSVSVKLTVLETVPPPKPKPWRSRYLKGNK